MKYENVTDLTERLRASVTYQYMPMNVRKLLSEAATTLETLTQENARLKAVSEDHFRNAQRLAGEVVKRDVENARLREALKDMLSGWRYIREQHGDLYGVGWDRAEEAARKALGGGDEQ